MKKVAYVVCSLVVLVLLVSGGAVLFRYELLALYLGIEQPTYSREKVDEATLENLLEAIKENKL